MRENVKKPWKALELEQKTRKTLELKEKHGEYAGKKGTEEI